MKGADGGMVDVAEEKVVNGPVPVPSECIPRGTVPPVRVKSSVRESCDFRKYVELGRNESVEQHKMIEKHNPDHANRLGALTTHSQITYLRKYVNIHLLILRRG